MKKWYYKLIMLFSLVTVFIVALEGCVDTSTQPIPDSVNYMGQIKLINIAGATGTVGVNVKDVNNNQLFAVSGLKVGDEYPAAGQDFLTLPAGSFTYLYTVTGQTKVDTLKTSLDTEKKVRVYLIDAGTGKSQVRQTLRYIWQTKNSAEGADLFPAGKAAFIVVNGSSVESIKKVRVRATTPIIDTTITFTTALAYGKMSQYQTIKAAANCTVTYYSATDSLGVTSLNAVEKSKFSTVFLGSKAANDVSIKVLIDD